MLRTAKLRMFRSKLIGLTLAIVTGLAGVARCEEKTLLVIAPQAFCPALNDFVAQKNKSIPTRLVALEQVLKATRGEDDPEKIKRFLFQAWKESHLGYVLLVGGAEVMPVRFMALDRASAPAADYAFYPSDLYYADLADAQGDFDDWNARKDSFHSGYFGEVHGEKNKQDAINFDQVTYHPRLGLGRWPVRTVEELRTVAAKSVAYEEGLKGNRKPGMHRAALFSVAGWEDSRPLFDRLASALAPAWAVEKRYYRDKRDDGTPPPDGPQLFELLNQGTGLVCHAGHGSDTSWYHCFSASDLGRIHNADRLPVMISCGCSTARFSTLAPYEAYLDVDGREHRGTNHGEVFHNPPPPPAALQPDRFNPPGLGEELLRNGPDGAVAYIGCNTGSQPCAMTLLDGFVQAAAREPHSRLGDCWSQAIDNYYRKEKLAEIHPTSSWYPPSIFFQGMKYMVFGDPTLPLQ